MASGTAHRVTRAALLAFVASIAGFLIFTFYKWLAFSLADATIPVVLIVVSLATAVSLLAPSRQ